VSTIKRQAWHCHSFFHHPHKVLIDSQSGIHLITASRNSLIIKWTALNQEYFQQKWLVDEYEKPFSLCGILETHDRILHCIFVSNQWHSMIYSLPRLDSFCCPEHGSPSLIRSMITPYGVFCQEMIRGILPKGQWQGRHSQ